MSESLEPARRSLATAARALDDFRRLSGAEASVEAPPSGWRVPAETGARAALDEARARIAELGAELDKVRRAAAAAADATSAERLEAARAVEEAATLRARAGALEDESAATRAALEDELAAARATLEAELAASREALQEAAARERRVEEDAREAAAAWTARLELLEREAVSAARAEAQRGLAVANARAAALEADLEAARGTAAALEAEARALREAAQIRAASRADSQSNADVTQRRASEASSRVSLLEAECVRLEKLRRTADQAAAEAEAQGRAVAEVLRREVRAANAALDQAAVEAGAAEAKTRAEADSLRVRLESATARLQALEREKRLEQARGAGDSAATATELLRTQAVAAALRQELSGFLSAAERKEDALHRELSAGRSALDAARREASQVRRELDEARRALSERAVSPPPNPSPAAPAAAAAATPPDVPEWSGEPVGEPAWTAETAPFIQPPVEPLLDPGWARLVRLVRPPVESAYAHLRRLSSTALTTGQKTLLRMAAASIAQASDSLSSIELALEEGPAPGAASAALPVLEASLAAWEGTFRGRGVVLAREFSTPLPDTAHDPKELRVALHHVLRNAAEAVPRGGRLVVRAWRGPDGGLRFEFFDDGPGFPAEWLARRFEPFVAPRRGRAGLGLSLVRRTLRRWGGDAEASNAPSGRGARLTLMFAPPPPPAPPA